MTLTLVTGAAGHIGANLVRALLERGRRVRALVRSDTRALAGLDVEQVRGDVAAPESLAPALRGVDVVHHLAGVISIQGDRDHHVAATNVEGVRNVARAALHQGVRRFVHYSSVHAFDTRHAHALITEESSRADASEAAYGRTKWAGERALAEVVAQGLPALTLMPSGVLGPFDFKPSLMGRFLLDLHDRRIPCLVQGGFDWVDVRDVVSTALRAEEAGRVGDCYLVTGRFASVVELARLAERCTGVAAPSLSLPMGLARAGVRVADGVSGILGSQPLWTSESLAVLAGAQRFDAKKARAELGHGSRPLEETVADSYAWFRSAGMLPVRASA